MIAQVKPKYEGIETEFTMGEVVNHPVFGNGKIVAKDESTYTIVFSNSGIKKIDKNFTKLKKV